MFEYITRNDKKVTINPKMITAVFQGEYEDECDIYTCDGMDAITVKTPYEKVSKELQYYVHTLSRG